MRTLLALSLVFFLPALAGCSNKSEPTQDSEIVLALNWFPEAEHGGFYAALVHGYYADVGLNVTIRPGGVGSPVVEEVATGRATFGVSNADVILLQREQGADVVALMAPLQHSPRCIMVHEESGFESIRDLSNVTLSMSEGRAFGMYIRKHARLEGVQIVPFNGGISNFMQGKAFAQQAYSFSEPFVAAQKGTKPRCLMTSEIGFDPYTSVLFCRTQTTTKAADVVDRFVKASVKGWQKYLEDPEETNRYINSINPEMSVEILEFGVDALRPLCREGDGPVGNMTRERWQALAKQLVEIGALQTTDPVENVLPTKPDASSKQ